MTKPRDSFLVNRLKEGDITAMEVLYIRYAPQIKSFAFGILKNEQESEDIVHDVFIKIWDERENLSDVYFFQSYIYTMTRNMVYNRLKHQGVHRKFAGFLKQSDTLSENPETRIITKNLLDLIHSEIQKLPEHQRAIFEMSRESGLTYKEISNKVGISPKTTQYHIGKVLAKLKNISKK